MRKAFFGKSFYFIERGIFATNCKFSNKNDLLCARKDFIKSFALYLHIINECLSYKFHPYSISTGDTKVEFVIYWVLRTYGYSNLKKTLSKTFSSLLWIMDRI